MTIIKVLTTKDQLQWHEYLSRLPIEQQDIYFTPEYYKLYEENGDGHARCFVFQQGDDIALYPFLINSVNELGYELDQKYFDIQGAYGYNGVVSSSYKAEFIASFYEAFQNYVAECRIISEFMRFHPLLDNVRFSKDEMDTLYDRHTVYLDLSKGYDSIWKHEYSSNNRNMIRKSLNSHVSCCVEEVPDHIEEFKAIYTATMKRLGAQEEYYFSQEYFNAFKTEMTDFAKIIICKSHDKVLAAALIMYHGKHVHYHLSGRSEHCKDNYVNNRLLDTAIRHFIEDQFSDMHFGGGRSNAEDDSLLKYKMNFSKQLANFYIGKKVHNHAIYNEVLRQWRERHPMAAQKYGKMLQGYRKIGGWNDSQM